MKRITEQDYNHLFKNGARILFDWDDYRFLDGSNYDLKPEESYIIIYFSPTGTTNYYQIGVKSMYEYITNYHYADKGFRDELIAEKLESQLQKLLFGS